MSVVVRLTNVTKRYQRGREVVIAVDDVSLELSSGSMTALVGPSGSGKTTLLNLIVGGDDPDEGAVTAAPDRPDWSRLAIVPQALGLLPELTMGENVGLPLRLGADAVWDVDEVMELLGLGALADRARRRPHSASNSAPRSPGRSSARRPCWSPTSRRAIRTRRTRPE